MSVIAVQFSFSTVILSDICAECVLLVYLLITHVKSSFMLWEVSRSINHVILSLLQDKDTSEVIGSDSYNTLQEKLVALAAGRMSGDSDLAVEEPTVDFAAATTATLGVPTPLPRELWSSETSFEDVSNDVNQAELKLKRKGDSEEAAMLMQV
jgi:hypothetical protein